MKIASLNPSRKKKLIVLACFAYLTFHLAVVQGIDIASFNLSKNHLTQKWLFPVGSVLKAGGDNLQGAQPFIFVIVIGLLVWLLINGSLLLRGASFIVLFLSGITNAYLSTVISVAFAAREEEPYVFSGMSFLNSTLSGFVPELMIALPAVWIWGKIRRMRSRATEN